MHLTIPTRPGTGLDEDAVRADVDGQIITAAQCRELLTQLESCRLLLALHDPHGGLTAVASPARLRRAARRRTRRTRNRTGQHPDRGDHADRDWVEGPGLRPPPITPGYRPTRDLDRHVRIRDRSCRHFGCTRKAVHADLDHHHRHPHGPTAVCNLCCYCRTPHRLKHQAPFWTRHLTPDGTLTITSPTRITRTTRPPGVERPLTVEDLAQAAPPSGEDAAHPKPESPVSDPPPF